MREPGTRGQGAHAVPVKQNDARATGCHIFIGRLHQLAARRPTPALQVPAQVFALAAHIEAVQGALASLDLKTRQFIGIDALHARPFSHTRGAFTRACKRCWTGLGQRGTATLRQRVTGQQPGHGAIPQRGNRVGNSGINECLSADDAAGSAGAIDHHESLWIGRDLTDPVDQFGARQAVRKGQAEV